MIPSLASDLKLASSHMVFCQFRASSILVQHQAALSCLLPLRSSCECCSCSILWTVFFFKKHFLLLFKYSCLHFPPTTPPNPSHPRFPPLILPLCGFVPVSFIHVPENSSMRGKRGKDFHDCLLINSFSFFFTFKTFLLFGWFHFLDILYWLCHYSCPIFSPLYSPPPCAPPPRSIPPPPT